MKIKFFLLTVLISTVLSAQDYKFGKVSEQELNEKYYRLDSTANAAYLYKYRKSYFYYDRDEGFQLNTIIHERIKIYNKAGFKYATKNIKLYKGTRSDNQEKISSIKAYTYNIDKSGKITNDKLNKNNIYKFDESKYWKGVKFTMPNLKPGTIIEYKYEVTSPYWSNVEEFVFQHDIPVKKLDAVFEIPEYYNFKTNMKGYLMIQPKKKYRRDKLTYRYEVPLSENEAFDPKTQYRTGEVEYANTIYSYNIENISALKNEPYVNNMNNYRSGVKYELSYTQLPNSTIKYYSTTWEDVVKTIYNSANFGAELNKSGYFEADIDALIAQVSDPVQKASLIFNHVKSNMKWNRYYSKYSRNGLRKAYKEHKGNVADINLMLTAMLRYAGLEANPVLVSTRKNGIPLFPTREGYNYVICGVELPNQVMLLDATSKNSTPNVLPFRALNWQGRMIRKSGSSFLIDLYPKQISKNTINLFAKIDESGTLKGQMRATKTGHKARSYRNKFNNVDEEAFIENLENEYVGMDISEFDVKNSKSLGKAVMENCKFTIENQADTINDKLYFSPLFCFGMDENPFKLEQREFPVDFGYPTEDIYRFSITIPEGYTVESLPQAKILELPDNLGSFTYRIKALGKTIQLVIDSKINTPIVSPKYYDALKAYFSALVEVENEQIVLTKT